MTEAIRVVDPGPSVAIRNRLAELHDLAQGRVWCAFLPQTRRLEGVADALLAGLGKRFNITKVHRNADRKWKRTRAWLVGEQIGDIFCTGFDELAPPLRETLDSLRSDLGIRLWLVSDSAADGVRRRRASHGVFDEINVVGQSEFLAQWKSAGSTEEAPPPELPPIPKADFAKFRSACLLELQPSDYKRVDDEWRRALDEALRLLRPQVSSHALAHHLQLAIATSIDNQVALVRIRAVQAAALRTGKFRISLDRSRLERTNGYASQRELWSEASDRLRWYMASEYSAAAVAKIASRRTADEIASLRLADIREDGTSLKIDGETFDIPQRAAGIMRAQLALRRSDGAASDDALFEAESSSGRKAATATTVQRWLQTISMETGISVTVRGEPRRPPAPLEWLRYHGIKVDEL